MVQVLAGFAAGFEQALIHIARQAARGSGQTDQQMAETFSALAAALPAEQNNRDIVAMVLRHIGAGVDGKAPGANLGAALVSMLH